jgi:uncharacterized membrane protein
MTADARTREANIGGLRRAGVVLGLGFGGFVDGIVLHQILQWHHMLTDAGFPPDSVRNLQVNTLADGLFHALTWVISLIGLVMLYRATVRRQYRPAGRVLAGAMVMGWGIFNLVEGLLNHYILGIHHVRPGPNQALYDAAFLALGALLTLAGWWVSRSRERETAQAAA